jgi:hypothetical protein
VLSDSSKSSSVGVGATATGDVLRSGCSKSSSVGFGAIATFGSADDVEGLSADARCHDGIFGLSDMLAGYVKCAIG